MKKTRNKGQSCHSDPRRGGVAADCPGNGMWVLTGVGAIEGMFERRITAGVIHGLSHNTCR